ncbi:uncharacterized protein LOC115263292 [Aedes albopictus]|uniref:ShKT domain-containing protein n=1 Tax=Aedes albopictus TaxID=7160 RepID=A0ABM1Y1T5_AEDAL
MYSKKLNKNDMCNSTYMRSFTGYDPCYKGPVSVTKPQVPEHRRRYHQQMETTMSTTHAVFVNRTCPRTAPDECPSTSYGESICKLGQAITQSYEMAAPCCDPCSFC